MALGLIGMSLLFFGMAYKLLKGFLEVKKEMHAVSHDVHSFKLITLEDMAEKSSLTQKLSPASITETGRQYLEETGLKPLIDKYSGEIVNELRQRNIENIYQLEETLMEVIEKIMMQKKPEILKVQIAAFHKGTQMDLLFYLASLYFRDKAAGDLNLCEDMQAVA